MGLWQQSSEPGAQEEINAAAMSSLAALCLMMILHYSHIYAFRSSSLVAICLAAAIACDTMQSQEPLQRPRCPSSVALMQYSVYIKAMLIGLEEIPKFSYKQNKRNKRIRQWVNWEVTTGFFTRCILWRCSSTSMPNSATANNQTPEVAPDISVEILSEQFSRDWRRGKNLPSQYVQVLNTNISQQDMTKPSLHSHGFSFGAICFLSFSQLCLGYYTNCF